jgi:hypothetical protein
MLHSLPQKEKEARLLAQQQLPPNTSQRLKLHLSPASCYHPSCCKTCSSSSSSSTCNADKYLLSKQPLKAALQYGRLHALLTP